MFPTMVGVELCGLPEVPATVDDLAGWAPLPARVAVELLVQRTALAARLSLNVTLTGLPAAADPVLVDALLSAFPLDRFAAEVLGFAAPDPLAVLAAASSRAAEVALGAARAGRFADPVVCGPLCDEVLQRCSDRSVFDRLLSFPSVSGSVADRLWPHAGFAARVGRVCRGDLAAAPLGVAAAFVWPVEGLSPPVTVTDFVALWSSARFRPELAAVLAVEVLRSSPPSLVLAAALSVLEVWLTAPELTGELAAVLDAAAVAVATPVSESSAAAVSCCAQTICVTPGDPRRAPQMVCAAAEKFFAAAGSPKVFVPAAALELRLSSAARSGGADAFPELVSPPVTVGVLPHVVPPSVGAVEVLSSVLGSDPVLWRLLFEFADSSLTLPECVELVAAVR